METWAPTPAMIETERSYTVLVQSDVCVEVLLWELFKVAEQRFDERAATGGDGVYQTWQIAVARYNAYQDLAAGKVTWH